MNINIIRNIEIDWQVGNTKLNEILFDVEMIPLFGEIEELSNPNLFENDSSPKKIAANGYKGLINKSNNNILGVVSSNYRLITNKEALEMGKEIYNEIFEIK